MAQDERLRQSIAERADADLQRAAIDHGARRMQTGSILGKSDRLAWRGEQREIGLRTVQHEIEFFRRQVRIAQHVRQFGIDLTGENEVAAPVAPGREQVERDVGVTAQAQTLLAVVDSLGNELSDHIDAALDDVAQHVGVVGRDVALLRRWDIEPAAGQEEEFVDLDVGRQPPLALRGCVGEIRVAAEQPAGERTGESPLEFAARPRPLQRQRREDAQMDGWVGGGARVERIGDVIGLAEAERQRQHDPLADAADDRLGDLIGILETDRRTAAAGHVIRSQPGSGRKRSP